MILHYFSKKENNDKKLKIANKIYSSNIELIQSIIKNDDFPLKHEFRYVFELMTVFLFIFFYSYKIKFFDKSVNQKLIELYILDLDKSFRDLGVGDMKIGKYVKSHVKKIYYRISKLEFIFRDNNYDDFEIYINKIFFNNKTTKHDKFSKYLFSLINSSLKRAKIEDISEFIIKDCAN